MKHHDVNHPPGHEPAPDGKKTAKVRKHKWLRRLLVFVVVLAVLLGIGRAIMPWAVRDYVNRTLDRNPLYSGRIGEIQIHLWRGAYSIEDVRLNKTSGNVPVPLFSAKQVDFAIQWNALVHGRIVGRVEMDEPQLNFVDAPSEGDSQTGVGGPWLQMIRDLFPFKINSCILKNGSVHFRTYQSKKPVDVYISQFQASIDNLGNIQNQTIPLVSTIRATGMAMDQAKFEINMTLDPFSYRPTFHLALRLLGLDVTKINDMAVTYGKFDFKRGWFDLVVEADSKEGELTGYVKPLFRNLQVFSLTEDLKDDNVLRFFWQALVGAVTAVLKNQPHDQFGTLIPFSGSVGSSTTTDILATLGNLLRNAFIRAYLPRLENGGEKVGDLKFDPPEITDPISAGSQ